MKKLLFLLTTLAIFSTGICQDLQVRSLDVTGSIKLRGNDVTNTLNSKVSTVTYNKTATVIDFKGSKFQQVTATDTLTLTSANLNSGKEVTVKITGGASTKVFVFPAWVFMTSTPASLAANKTAILTLRSYGTTDASVIASYLVQP